MYIDFPLPLWDSVAVCMTVIHVALVATISRISLTDQGQKKQRPVNQPYMTDQGRRQLRSGIQLIKDGGSKGLGLGINHTWLPTVAQYNPSLPSYFAELILVTLKGSKTQASTDKQGESSSTPISRMSSLLTELHLRKMQVNQ